MNNNITPRGRLAAEAVGWYGTFAILLAYILVSFGFVSGKSLVYQLIVLSGCVGLIIISIVKNVKQTVLINLIMGGVSLLAIANILRG